MLWYCVASSLLFGLTSIIAYEYKHYVISGILFALCVSSLLYHTERLYNHSETYFFTTSLIEHNKKNVHFQIVRLLDAFVLWLFIAMVLYLHFQKMVTRKLTAMNISINAFIIFSLSYIAYIYYYGYQIQDYCFHPHSYIAEKWHMSIHIIAVLATYSTFLV